ncbi:MAG: VWA domain-containing protein [Clostridiales bacterium]|nr:VWA domain-containing protein [Clostridiales bacterium]
MSNFQVEFLNSPWWLLLLIPAFAFALIPHFMVAKKYRRNRNRITSLVLHLVIMTLCIFTLSGMYFSYDKTDTSNEVLILVDMSFSNEQYENDYGKGEYDSANKNRFIRSVIDASGSDYKIGVVTFGYNQVYAAKMSTDTDKVYQDYIKAKLPNNTASDIAAALEYARTLFTNKRGGKIVLISDGAETDGDAITAIRMAAANGIQIHTVHFPNSYAYGNEVMISNVELPDYTVSLDETFKVVVTVRARNNGIDNAVIKLYDDSTALGEQLLEERAVSIASTEQTFEFEVTLTEPDMHKLRFSISSGNDEISFNNDFYSYVYINSFNNILVIERELGDSTKFVDSLGEEYTATVVQVADEKNMPNTVDALRQYDEVVLMNIANRDMPEGFIDILYTYVHDIGGGLFTVGGMRVDEYGNLVPNMYDRSDMYDIMPDGTMSPTLYQDMLPVQSINYTPPIGVMIIIDRSGSMSTEMANGTRLDEAKQGARAAVYALSERDYCGIMTLDTEFQVEQSLIPATQQARLLRTINDIEMGGGTQFAGAIKRAGEALLSRRDIERRHIILISDGEPGDKTFEDYGDIIAANYEAGITFSMVAIGIDQNSQQDQNMRKAAELGHGRYYRVWDSNTLPDEMSKELRLPEITEISSEPFQPKIRDHTAMVNGVTQADIPMLGGYFGTKVKDDIYVSLSGEFVPILAHWRYGEGRVGSFMCDLSGDGWSQAFLASEAGVKIVNNAIRTLLPTVNIRPSAMTVDFTEDNYSTRASIFTEMKDGDRIELSVFTVPTGDQTEQLVSKIVPTKEQGYSNIKFEITTAGVYRVYIVKLDAQNNVLAEHNAYRVFSYSEEYNTFTSEADCEELMKQMALLGGGKQISLDEPWSIFDEKIDALHNIFDPRWIFIIIAIALFLLDIAVRKFKWKWIHELIRERKEKHAESQSTTEKV